MIFKLDKNECDLTDGNTCPFFTVNDDDAPGESDLCALLNVDVENNNRPWACKTVLMTGFAVIPLAFIKLSDIVQGGND